MGSVLLKDLNDFIQPSVDCIKPSELKPQDPYQINNTNKYPIRTPEEILSISLKDCLACSGCITTSESLLIAQQTGAELEQIIRSNQYQIAVTISPQSVISLCHYYGHPHPTITVSVLVKFFRQLGCVGVFDSSAGRTISHLQLANEFVHRYQMNTKQEPTTFEEHCAEGQNSHLPLLTSVCPGWICYVEKMYPTLIPMLSRVRSPQQMMGHLVKSVWNSVARHQNLYHVTVMPCADKKLEATRSDFEHDSVRDVDCVLTTAELADLFIRFDFDPRTTDHLVEDFDVIIPELPSLCSHLGSGTGGYVENVLMNAASILFPRLNLSINNFYQMVQVRQTKNKDFLELTLQDPATNMTLLRAAWICGFRNIQNVVRQLKTGKCRYDIVEINACPSGCLNGGGQLKNGNIDALMESYLQLPTPSAPNSNLINRFTLEGLQASFHALPKTESTRW